MLTQVNATAEKATILHHQSTATTRDGPDGHKDDTATGSARTHNLAFQLTLSCKITTNWNAKWPNQTGFRITLMKGIISSPFEAVSDIQMPNLLFRYKPNHGSAFHVLSQRRQSGSIVAYHMEIDCRRVDSWR